MRQDLEAGLEGQVAREELGGLGEPGVRDRQVQLEVPLALPDLLERPVRQVELVGQEVLETLVLLGQLEDQQDLQVQRVKRVQPVVRVEPELAELEALAEQEVQEHLVKVALEVQVHPVQLEEQEVLDQLGVQEHLVGAGSQLGKRSSRQPVGIKPSRWRLLQPQTETL